MPRMLTTLAAAGVLAAIAPLSLTMPAAARPWQPLAAPEGGFVLRYYPSGSAVLARTGVTTFRSVNGGASWSIVDSLPISTPIQSAVNAGPALIALLSGGALYRSDDHGATFTPVATAADTSQFIELLNIGAVIIARTGAGELFRSTDLAQTWTPLALPTKTTIFDFSVDDTRLTVRTFNQLFASTDLGDSWSAPFDVPFSTLLEIVGSAGNAQYAHIRDFSVPANTGFHRSTDGGLSWTLLTSVPAGLNDVNVVTTHAGAVLAIAADAANTTFLMRSTDDGLTWTTIPAPPGGFTSTIAGVGASILASTQSGPQRSSTLGQSWSPAVQGMYAVSVPSLEASAHALYTVASSNPTLLTSTDALTWSPLATLPGNIGSVFVTTSGPAAAQDELFTTVAGQGLYRSTSGGASFSPVNNGIPAVPMTGSPRTVLDIVRAGNTLVLAVAGSSRPGRHGVGGSTFGAEGFLISANNGQSWTQSNAGFPTIGINEIFQPCWDEIDNLTVAPNGAIIATTRSLGVWRSTNNGASWQAVNTGVPTCAGALPLFADAITFQNKVILSIDFPGNPGACPNVPTQILVSNDNGSTWSPSSTGMPVESRAGRLSIHDNTINVLIRPTISSLYVYYRSTDAGATWTPIDSPPAPLTPLRTRGKVSIAGTSFLGLWALTPPPACPGDANNDNQINAADLSVLLASFGAAVPPGSGADFNNDGAVNAADLSILLATFGTAC